MANWYYYDNAGTKQGPFTDEHIEELIERRVIVQQTRLETEAEQQELAEQVHRFKQKFDSLLPKNTQDSERITISLPTKKEIIDTAKNISGKAKEQGGKFLKEHSPSFAAYRAYRGDQQIVIYLCGVALISVFLFFYGIITALGILLLGIVGVGVDYLIFVNTISAEMQGIIKDAREKKLGYLEIKTAIQQYYYEQGERYVSQEEYKKAIESYEKAVKFGLTEAQHKRDDTNMKLQNKLADGNMKLQGNTNYEWGESCAAQNEYIKAISFYEKAVQCGHPEAQHKISEVKAKLTAAGKEYCEQGDNWYSKSEYEKAVECYEKSVSYGNPEAQSKRDEAEAKLGEYFYEEGKKYDSQHNVNRAIACYKKAAEYGHTEARRKLEIAEIDTVKEHNANFSDRYSGNIQVDTAEEHNTRFNDRYNGDIQEVGVGIGRIVVFISVALGVVSYFLPCERFRGMNAFQGYQYLLKNGESLDALYGIAFLVFIYPVFTAMIKKTFTLTEQIGGFVSGIAGIVLGIILIVNCDTGIFGNVAGAGTYVFIIACIGLIAGTALYNCRLPNVGEKSYRE